MKETGIVRKVDELGRVVLPIELRRTLNIEQKDLLEIYVEDDAIILRKKETACIFCGGLRDLQVYRGRNVCANCIRRLSENR
ncbi:MAG: AbrB/MazE/SpoVT family DNA-binding domain-containing protein [Eubacteriales bacterium]|nr:AbrB/MazE/SpoVT family DNA-binding domain-containing protein [Eubacteriales bacterium]